MINTFTIDELHKKSLGNNIIYAQVNKIVYSPENCMNKSFHTNADSFENNSFTQKEFIHQSVKS